MERVLDAVFDGKVFIPLEPLDFEAGTRFELTILAIIDKEILGESDAEEPGLSSE